MKYQILLTDSAYRDLESIKSFIALDNPNAAKKYIAKIFDRFDRLKDFPHSGVIVHNRLFDYASCLYLPCVNHVAIYQVNELAKCVYILRALSHFQDWKNIVNKELPQAQRPLTEDDDTALAPMNVSMYCDVWANSLDEDNRKYVPDEVFETLEEASETVNRIIKNYGSTEGPYVYAVIRKRDQANMGYVQRALVDGRWEIGYHIAKRYTGKGYATEAVSLFLAHLAQSTDIPEIYATALASNKASRRVLEKNGFALLSESEDRRQGKTRRLIVASKKLR